jgi:hypothetical protein
MDQSIKDLLYIGIFFILAVVVAWLYIQYIKCRFKEIFEIKPKPIQIKPVFVIAEPVYETNEVALVV